MDPVINIPNRSKNFNYISINDQMWNLLTKYVSSWSGIIDINESAQKALDLGLRADSFEMHGE